MACRRSIRCSTGSGARAWAIGAVYGAVFVALLLIFDAFFAAPSAVSLFLSLGFIAAAVAGAVLFPLARAILEFRTDSTPPFFRRLWGQVLTSKNYLIGVVVGIGVLLAFQQDLPHQPGLDRFIFGFIVGAGALCRVRLSGRFLRHRLWRARALRSWRPYVLGGVLGGLVGGAIGWYFDAGQLDVVSRNFASHAVVNYAAAGLSDHAYTITPFFSKWGLTNLGVAGGGVRLLFDDSLSGVIQWIFAAPLFSINLFFLTALLKRDLAPLRLLFSAEGVGASLITPWSCCAGVCGWRRSSMRS